MINELRSKLKCLYEEFVTKYGYLNKSRNKSLILKDSYGFTIVSSLERKEENNTWAPADVLLRSNQVEEQVPVTDSVVEAMAWVLSKYGYLNLSAIEKIVDMETDMVISELGDLCYLNPATMEFEESSKFLSGNIYQKIAIAEWQLAEVMNEKEDSVYEESENEGYQTTQKSEGQSR